MSPERAVDGSADAPRDYSGAALDALNRVTTELANIFNDAGFEPIEPSILQPSDPLYDLYGEEIWDRAFFIAEDGERGGWCLRPDFTAPVARAHLATGLGAARYGYFGPVFRRARDGSDAAVEQLQAGVEIISEAADGADAEADAVEREAEVFDICRKALSWAGVADYDVATGDLSIVFGLLDGLDLAESWRRRLKRHIWRPARFHALLRGYGEDAIDEAEAGAPRLAFLKGVGGLSPAEAERAVAEISELSDVPQIGVRSAAEVADRFLELAADARRRPLSRATIGVIEAALAVRAPLPDAVEALAEIARAAGVDLGARLEAIISRAEALAARGVDVETLAFDAAFGRNLEYYDGFVFEMTAPGGGAPLKLGGGGRYDRLFAALGAARPMRGVGAALRPEAILAAASSAPSADQGPRA